MSLQQNILLVEDDKNLGFLLSKQLEQNGYSVDLCEDGEKGWTRFNESYYDICILDIMMPKLDGLSLIKKIREINVQVPVVFLTARNLTVDKAQAYTSGADDYVTKPFDIQELLFKIKAILRRTGGHLDNKETEFTIGALKLNTKDRSLTEGEGSVSLSQKECDLLEIFFSNLNEAVPRSFILKKAWGNDDYFSSKSMDVYLTKIRKLLKPEESLKLQNIHGFGYKLIQE